MKFPCEDCISLAMCVAKTREYCTDNADLLGILSDNCSIIDEYIPYTYDWPEGFFIPTGVKQKHGCKISPKEWKDRLEKVVKLFFETY